MVSQLLYRGPSIEVLHEEYAKKGRIDEQAAIKASDTVDIQAPVERVWALLSDPTKWPTFDPAIHDVHQDGAVAVDTRFTWANGRTHLKSRFAVVEPGQEITWTGEALGSKAVHRHVLDSTAENATRVTTEESMAGPLLGLFYSSAKLKTALEKWLTALKTAAEQPR